MNVYISWYSGTGCREQSWVDVEVRRSRQDSIVAGKSRELIMYKAGLCAPYSQAMCLLPVFAFYRGWRRYFCVPNCRTSVMRTVCRELVNTKRSVGVWNPSLSLVLNLPGIRTTRRKPISNSNRHTCCVIETDKSFFDCVGSTKGIKTHRGYMSKSGLMRAYGERTEALTMLGTLWCMMWRCSSGLTSRPVRFSA